MDTTIQSSLWGNATVHPKLRIRSHHLPNAVAQV